MSIFLSENDMFTRFSKISMALRTAPEIPTQKSPPKEAEASDAFRKRAPRALWEM